VGINHYDHVSPLFGCVSDALSVASALGHHADGRINFATPRILTASSPVESISRTDLKGAVKALFEDDSDVALFYFSGHGHAEDGGGYLCASDCTSGDDGLSLAEVMGFANRSPAKNKIIILDSCFSGVAGASANDGTLAEVKEGVTILTASTATQYATEQGGSGVFTDLMVDALNGAAANLVGHITPGSVYGHIDQSLGPWKQRPVFKTNVKNFVSLREAIPPIDLGDLRELTTHFPTPTHQLALDPSYEPDRSTTQDRTIPPPDPARNAVFKVLQNYARVNLVRPVGEPHMWHAAMNSASCELTVLGQHYWRLVDDKLI